MTRHYNSAQAEAKLSAGLPGYEISLYPSRAAMARHASDPPNIKFYVTTFRNPETDFEGFVNDLVYLALTERICLECRLNNYERVRRGWKKRLIRGRCKPYQGWPCKMGRTASLVLDILKVMRV